MKNSFSLPALCKIAALTALALVTGCASEHYRRGDGVTDFAGDAVAQNTALQVVDPWAEGVEDTDIKSPYEPSQTPGGGDGAAAPAPKTTN